MMKKQKTIEQRHREFNAMVAAERQRCEAERPVREAKRLAMEAERMADFERQVALLLFGSFQGMDVSEPPWSGYGAEEGS